MPCVFVKYRKLLRLVLGGNVYRANRDAPYRTPPYVLFAEHLHRTARHIPRQLSRMRKLHLVFPHGQVVFAYSDSHTAAFQPILAQLRPYLLRQLYYSVKNLALRVKVCRSRRSVPDGFYGTALVFLHHGRVFISVRIYPQHLPHLSEVRLHSVRVAVRYIAYRPYSAVPQLFVRFHSYAEHLVCRQIPYFLLKVVTAYHSHGIRFFHVRAELREYLVERNSRRYRKPRLTLHALTYLVCNADARAEQISAPRHVKKALVDTHSFNKVGVSLVNLTNRARV